jgi:hypothetical protein
MNLCTKFQTYIRRKDDRFFFFPSCRPYYIHIYPRHATDTCVDTQVTEISLCQHVSLHVRPACHCVDTCVGNVSYRHGIQHECWIEQIKLIKFHIMGSVGFGVFNIEKSAIF